MIRQYLGGVDLGTSTIKAALYLVDGTLVADANAEVMGRSRRALLG